MMAFITALILLLLGQPVTHGTGTWSITAALGWLPPVHCAFVANADGAITGSCALAADDATAG
jgi:hypothetical protein